VTAERRFFHHHEAGALKMPDQTLGDDLGHDLISVVDSLTPLEPQCEGERRGEIAGIGGRELVVGQQELPEDDKPDHAGERGEGGHRRRAQDDALAYAQSGARSGW
jgi:hypothetical protein